MPFLDETTGPAQFVDVGHKPKTAVTPDAQQKAAMPFESPEPTLTPAIMGPALALSGSEKVADLWSYSVPEYVDMDSLPRPELEPVEVVTSRPLPEQPGLWGAAFRQNNMVASTWNGLADRSDFGPIDPDHDPLSLIQGTPAESYWKEFVSSRNEAETRHLMQRVEDEMADRRVLSEAGFGGFLASSVAAILDLPTLLPGGAVYRSLKTGEAAARTALSVGAAAGAGAAVQEVGLHDSQITRTWEESAVNIGGTVVLGALLGGGLGALSARQFSHLAVRLEAEMRVPADAMDDAFGIGGLHDLQTAERPSRPSSAGAAAVRDKPDVELQGALGLEKALAWQDPLLRQLQSVLPAARETMAELAETVLGLTRNMDGVTTAPVGGAVETKIKTNGYSKLGQAVTEMDRAFNQYRFGKEDKFAAPARAWVENRSGQSTKLTYKEFKEEVGRAMARHDKHDIPEVARAAKAFRDVLIDPLAKDAVQLKLLAEELLTGKAPQRGNIVNERPSWGTEQHALRRSVENMVADIVRATGLTFDPDAVQGAIDALARVNPDILEGVQRAYTQYLGNITPQELDWVRSSWDFVRSQKGSKPTERLVQWIVKRGGVQDPGGDVIKIIGSHKKRPFLISKKGSTLDDMALRAWEEGFLGNAERPTINDLLDAMREDFNVSPVYRAADSEAMIAWHGAQELAAELDKVGAGKAKTADEAVRAYLTYRASQGSDGAAPIANLLADVRRAFEGALGHPSAAPPAKRSDFLPEQYASEIWDDAGQSYITRIWNKEKIKAKYPEFKKIIVDYLEASQRRAVGVLARLSEEGAAGPEVDNLAAFVGLERGDLEFSAQNVLSHILGHPDGRMLFELPDAVRGPLKARTLRIRDELVEEFLERDIETIARFYTRTMAPDIEMTRAFGSVDMKEAFARIADDADAMASRTADEGLRSEIMNAKEDAIKDLQAVADRLRGTYAMPSDPTGFLPRAGRVIRSVNYMRLLGGMTISAIPDTFRAMMVHGVTSYFADGLAPLIRNLEAVKLAGEEVKLAGTALDMILDTRAMTMADVMDDFGRYSKFEKVIQSAQSNFGVVSLMAPWNAAMKQWTGMISMTNIVRASLKVADGTATKAEIGKLAASSIDQHAARLIAEQFKAHGKIVDGVYLPNTKAWDISNPNTRLAQDALRGAVVRDADRIIVTPGQDKPLWFSTEVGKIVAQFKGFGFASMQRVVLAGLQQRDAGVLMGSLMMLGMGGIVQKLRGFTADKPDPDTTAQWVANAVERSGLTGYLFDVNHFAERFTLGAVGIAPLTGGKPLSRYAARNWLDAVLGPTGGLLQNVAATSGSLSQAVFKGGSVSESDIRALRRTLPYQNLFYMSWLFRQMERGVAQAAGAKPSPGIK